MWKKEDRIAKENEVGEAGREGVNGMNKHCAQDEVCDGGGKLVNWFGKNFPKTKMGEGGGKVVHILVEKRAKDKVGKSWGEVVNRKIEGGVERKDKLGKGRQSVSWIETSMAHVKIREERGKGRKRGIVPNR